MSAESMSWNPHVERVIISHELRGTGETADPYRRILTVWSLDGKKLAEAPDPETEPRSLMATLKGPR